MIGCFACNARRVGRHHLSTARHRKSTASRIGPRRSILSHRVAGGDKPSYMIGAGREETAPDGWVENADGWLDRPWKGTNA